MQDSPSALAFHHWSGVTLSHTFEWTAGSLGNGLFSWAFECSSNSEQSLPSPPFRLWMRGGRWQQQQSWQLHQCSNHHHCHHLGRGICSQLEKNQNSIMHTGIPSWISIRWRSAGWYRCSHCQVSMVTIILDTHIYIACCFNALYDTVCGLICHIICVQNKHLHSQV